jgi:uncharacterized membrane-anchored protein
MYTTLYLLAVLPLVSGLLYLLAAVRVWRSNQLLAVLMLLFWPIGLYALVRFWKEDDEKVRMPLLGSFVVIAAWIGFLAWGFSHQAPPPENTLVEESDESDSTGSEDGGIADKVRHSIAIANLERRSGRVELGKAHAAIEVPEHFRFIDRDALVKAFAGTEGEPDSHLLGWLVHERVDLAADDAWHIDVHALDEGFIADDSFAALPREALFAAAQRETEKYSDDRAPGEPAFKLVRFAEAPRLDTATHSVTWVEELAYVGHSTHVLDCTAVKLGRRGALAYSISETGTQNQELCLRSVRLAAGRSSFDAGHAYADHSRLLDHKATYDLIALVTGAFGNEKQ